MCVDVSCVLALQGPSMCTALSLHQATLHKSASIIRRSSPLVNHIMTYFHPGPCAGRQISALLSCPGLSSTPLISLNLTYSCAGAVTPCSFTACPLPLSLHCSSLVHPHPVSLIRHRRCDTMPLHCLPPGVSSMPRLSLSHPHSWHARTQAL